MKIIPHWEWIYFTSMHQIEKIMCGGWDSNPRRPMPRGPEPRPFDLTWEPPPEMKYMPSIYRIRIVNVCDIIPQFFRMQYSRISKVMIRSQILLGKILKIQKIPLKTSFTLHQQIFKH